MRNEHILVGYKPFSSTDEEFLICTTDRAKQYVEETQMDREVKQKVERSVFRVPGPWDSKSSEKDIEEIKPVQTREKVYMTLFIMYRSVIYYKLNDKYPINVSYSLYNNVLLTRVWRLHSQSRIMTCCKCIFENST